MQLGFVSAILPDYSLEQVFRTASEFGYDCVELMCWPPGNADRRYAGVTHIDVTSFDDSQASKINELATRYQQTISALGYYPNPLSPRPQVSDSAITHLKLVIEAASSLGIGRVSTFIGRDRTKSIDDNWPKFLDVWSTLVDYAEQRNVCIGIENCPMLFSADEWPGGQNLAISPDIWRRMFDAIPTPAFGLTLDPSHLVWQQMDYLAPLREFADRIFHIHAKDVRIDRHRLNEVGILAAPLKYHSPKLPGLGEVDWGEFFSVLNDTGYCGSVCVEVEDRAYEESIDSRRRALLQSYNYLRNFTT